jgi:hypothetical protein
MATKVKLMTLLQQVRGYAEVTNRRPPPRPPMLYLMELREQTGNAQVPKRRLAVATDASSDNTPLPIKITHIKSDECPLPIVVG